MHTIKPLEQDSMAHSIKDTEEAVILTRADEGSGMPCRMDNPTELARKQDMSFSTFTGVPKLPRICTSSKAMNTSPVSPLNWAAACESTPSPAAGVARRQSVSRNSPGLPTPSSRSSLTLPGGPLTVRFNLSRQPSCSEIPSPWSGAAFRRCSGDYTARFRRLSSFDFAAQLQAEDDAAFDDAHDRSWLTPLAGAVGLQRVL